MRCADLRFDASTCCCCLCAVATESCAFPQVQSCHRRHSANYCHLLECEHSADMPCSSPADCACTHCDRIWCGRLAAAAKCHMPLFDSTSSSARTPDIHLRTNSCDRYAAILTCDATCHQAHGCFSRHADTLVALLHSDSMVSHPTLAISRH